MKMEEGDEGRRKGEKINMESEMLRVSGFFDSCELSMAVALGRFRGSPHCLSLLL